MVGCVTRTEKQMQQLEILNVQFVGEMSINDYNTLRKQITLNQGVKKEKVTNSRTS